ncbi:MAG: TIGR01620 family protein [Rhodobacteraceae bacterium]|jgi:putative membrane protein|nr:TIGR01620 family protein [Paracoccaceae bacterium]
MTADRPRPVLIELDTPPPDPAAAPPVPEAAPPPDEAALARAVRQVARPASAPARLFWGAAGTLAAFVLSLAVWDYATELLARSTLLGSAAVVLVGLVVLALLLLGLREAAGLARLGRLDSLRAAAAASRAGADLAAARAVLGRLGALYAGRAELRWGRARLAEKAGEVVDADALLAAAETDLLGPLDTAARAEIEAAARQVAAATALVPLALADVAVALAANLRMIRRIAEIYGGHAGALGSWRIARAVFAHLVATGAVAVGDDLVSSVAGGGLLAKVSRRFGEGVVNGALTARVGVAAMEVCRPLPFVARTRPRVTEILAGALAGLFDRSPGGA